MILGALRCLIPQKERQNLLMNIAHLELWFIEVWNIKHARVYPSSAA
jgi:hypothetical protein